MAEFLPGAGSSNEMQPFVPQIRLMLPVAAIALGAVIGAAFLNLSGGEAALNQEQVSGPEPTIKQIIVANPEAALPQAPVAPTGPVIRQEVMVVASGDTLMDLAVRAGAPGNQAHAAINRLTEAFDPRRLQIGQEITLQLEENAGNIQLAALGLRPDVASEVWVTAAPSGDYEVAEIETALEVQYAAGRGLIEGSLYQATKNAGIPDDVLYALIRIYSYDIDFQRDIRAGDGFEVLFEQEVRPDGSFARNGDVLYATLSLQGTPHTIYRFETEDGTVDYFSADGRSIRKALMRTPIDGARMSSSFGMRKHPVLGYSRMHRGVDFAAPRGTPIYAAGDGVVEFAGRNKGYGNYVRIRHNRLLKTAYAHMRGFADGMSKGDRVSQGDVIGYVGTTGLSTGPHLHYEVLLEGAQTNPMSVEVPAGPALEGGDLARFQEWATQLDLAYSFLSESPTVADSR